MTVNKSLSNSKNTKLMWLGNCLGGGERRLGFKQKSWVTSATYLWKVSTICPRTIAFKFKVIVPVSMTWNFRIVCPRNIVIGHKMHNWTFWLVEFGPRRMPTSLRVKLGHRFTLNDSTVSILVRPRCRIPMSPNRSIYIPWHSRFKQGFNGLLYTFFFW